MLMPTREKIVHRRIWRPKAYKIPDVARLSVEARISPLLALLLLNRGIRDASEVRRFLSPSPADIHDPYRLPGMVSAVQRLRRALDTNERIVIYGDYDVDGTSATALLLTVLRKLGGDVHFYIPNRHTEGYGMNIAAMRHIKEELEADVLLTVDCGVTAQESIAEAHRLGMDVIVSDHHSVDAERLPDPKTVVALINPELEGHDYPFRELAGVGLAFKLAQGILGCSFEENHPLLMRQLDLVALGTIADVAPLRGENRALAKLGLEVLSRKERLGIRALCDVAGILPEAKVTSRDVSFRLGPRINAAGRVDTAHKVITLLTTDSEAEAREVAQTLHQENVNRQSVERRILESAIEIIEEKELLQTEYALFLAQEGWHAGVVGIVAQRLVERYGRPTVLIALEGEKGRGSGRSIPEFDLHAALLKSREYMLTFGGHAAAAGMTVERKAVEKLRRSFLRTARTWLKPEMLHPRLNLDAILPLDALTLDAVSELEALEPFGESNPPPKVGVRGLRLAREPLAMGNERKHLKLTLTDGQNSLSAIRWNAVEDLLPLQTAGVEVDVAGSVAVNEYQSERSVQMFVDDWVIHPPRPVTEKNLFPPRERPAWVRIVDGRGEREKNSYLEHLFSRKEPTLVYVRDETAAAELLEGMKERSPMFAEMVSKGDTSSEALRACLRGEPPFLIVPFSVTLLADPSEWKLLRHIVFFQPPPEMETFLERSASAVHRWRSHPPTEEEIAYIHLLFHEGDLQQETVYLDQTYPLADTLRKAARVLRARNEGLTLEEWASAGNFHQKTVQAAVTILKELGYVRDVPTGKNVRFQWVENNVRRKLEESFQYREHLVVHKRWELTAARWRHGSVRDFWEELQRLGKSFVDE